MKTISLIYAVSENHVIGKDNTLPWHLSTDQKRFKKLTTGQAIIMGSRTFESIGQALPDRQNIVLSRHDDYHAKGAEVAHSLQEAIDKAESDDIFIIGGADIYSAALPLADRIYETRVHAVIDGDSFFDPDLSHWLEESSEQHPADAKNDFATTFTVYVRQ